MYKKQLLKEKTKLSYRKRQSALRRRAHFRISGLMGKVYNRKTFSKRKG
jgi:hypothetical protein